MPKLCDIDGVRTYDSLTSIELWRHDGSQRLTVVTYESGSSSYSEIDLVDLVDWVIEELPCHFQDTFMRRLHQLNATSTDLDVSSRLRDKS